MREVGIDLGRHRSSHVTDIDLSASDLIIVMTRQHAMDLLLLDPAMWPRTFPIVDLVRRGRETGSIGVDEDLREWVSRVHKGRRPSELVALQPSEEVSDPVGRPVAQVRRTRDLLSSLVDELAGLLTAQPGHG
jgi:protein-tyrosine-phosphatase